MPKRTDDFQSLIFNIYKQMANSGETITESAILNEPENGTPREIDILLETRVFGISMRIAVECRGRENKDDIQWIDSLIGKYRDLAVDKIVAVSKSGFSRGAQKKAAANRIDTLTLEAALETNWPREFMQLGMGTLTRNDSPREIRVITEPLFTSSISLSAPLFTENGEYISTLEEAAKWIYENSKDAITKGLNDQISISLKTLADIQSHFGIIEIPFTLPKLVFIDDVAQRVKVVQIILTMFSTFLLNNHHPQRYILGDKQITQAVVTDGSNGEFTITAIQESDKPNQVRVHVEKILETLPKKPKK